MLVELNSNQRLDMKVDEDFELRSDTYSSEDFANINKNADD